MKIHLDAGHGGKDPGAVGFELKEKDLTLAIVKKIGKILDQYKDVKVYYTRKDDRFLELSERAALANKEDADFFISVHINAGGGTGYETFISSNASDKSVAYQNMIHPEIYKQLGKVKDRGKKRANYAVLRQTKMPAILTEILFIDTLNDNKLLKQDDYLDKVAQGHVNGLVKAFGLKKEEVVKPLANPKPANPKPADTKPADPKPAEKVNVITGWYYEGSKGLAELEKFLKDKGLNYKKEKA
jgi:N-acetylmuramoyl-L-alanine amidase